MEPLETVIGLEIHVELKTASKMFCACRNEPTCAEPNRHVCPTCMGLVGTLPLLNRRAFEQTVLLASAMKSTVARRTKWDRKSYFYPDLPKGYQISQYDLPIGQGGELVFPLNGSLRSVRMNRVHLEEDAAKSLHEADRTLIDFNRSSVPLMEMVTEPDLRSSEEAKALLKAIRRLVKDLGISDADMEKGQMRCDASVSLRRIGEQKLYPRVEIKNLNSFRSVENALEYQREKLTAEWHVGAYPAMASTVLWDDDRAATFPMRSKETASDYRYFPEPDIPVVELSEEAVERLVREVPPLRKDRFADMVEDGMDMEKLVSILDTAELFWSFDREYRRLDCPSKRETLLNFYMAEVSLLLKSTGTIPFDSEEILLLVEKVEERSLPISTARKFLASCAKPGDIARSIGEFDTLSRTTTMDLGEVVDRVLSDNSSLVGQYLAGEHKVLQALIGGVMRETKGMFGGEEVIAVIRKRLETI